MLQVNQSIPRNIIAVLDALAELGKVVEEQRTIDSENLDRAALSTAEQPNSPSQEVQP